MNRRATLFSLIALLLCAKVSGQEVVKTRTIYFDPYKIGDVFFLNGNVDFYNSFLYLPSPESYKTYQNLQEITIENQGDSPVESPMVSINGSDFFWDETDLGKILNTSGNFSDSALLIWNHFNEKTIHRYYPFPGYTINTSLDLLTFYGYGICYNQTSAIAKLSVNNNKNYYSLAQNKHAVTEFQQSNNSALIDTDLKVFYKNFQNELSSAKEISSDRYLIRRTHHYGKQYSYDKRVNEYISNIYVIKNNSGTLNPSKASFRYQLDPGEFLLFDYSPAKYFAVADGLYFNGNLKELANGRFEYDWGAASNNYYFNSRNLKNLQVIQTNNGGLTGSKLSKVDPSSEASLTFQVETGFPVVLFDMYFDLTGSPASTQLDVQVSTDSVTWIKPRHSYMDKSGRIHYSFDTHANPLLNKVIVKAGLNSTLSNPQILNFGYTANFQVNRLSLPQLKCGQNQIELKTEQNDQDIQLKVNLKYKEKTADVPVGMSTASYPKNKAVIYGDVGKFSWDYIGDDQIVNYEFLLTEDTLHQFPLSPTFNTYTIGKSVAEATKWNIPSGRGSQTVPTWDQLNPAAYIISRYGPNALAKSSIEGNVVTNEFTVNEEGFLNSGNRYFWKVRPLSSDSVWGPWSQFFSFTVEKPMPPIDLAVTLTASDEVLTWKQNPVGTTVKQFEIYASDEYMGFEPTSSNLIAVTQSKKISIKEFPYTFFRVMSVDTLGNKSETSEYVSRPYPYLKIPPKAIFPDSVFNHPITFNPFFYPLVGKEDDQYAEIYDNIRYRVNKTPSWLTFNYATHSLTGKASLEMLRKEFYQGLNVVELEFFSRYVETRKFNLYLKYIIPNSKPEFSGIDTLLFNNNAFQFEINYNDQDQKYGDSVFFQLRNQPSWLQFKVTQGSVVFYGNPTQGEGLVASQLIGHDKYGDSSVVDIRIKVIPTTLSYYVHPPKKDSLVLNLNNSPFGADAVTGGYSFRLKQTLFDNLKVDLVDNQQLMVTGEFCFPEGSRVLSVPMGITTQSSQVVQFQLVLEIYNYVEQPTAIIGYHPTGNDFLVLVNKECLAADLNYWMFDMTGQNMGQGSTTLLPDQKTQITLEGLSPGVYIFTFYSRGKQNAFRFFKE